MNLLTKEECREALKILSTQPDESFCNGSICGVSDCGYCPKNTASKLLKHLINDHFSNPPLKFEKLQERETYYHIYYGWISIRSISDCECILINTLNSDGYKQIEFEEDCFYRKEVQE